MKLRRILLNGLGNVGRRFLELLRDRPELLAARHDVAFRVVGAADSRGAASCEDGLPLAELVELKLQGRSGGELPGRGEMGATALGLLGRLGVDLVLEAASTNYRDAQPGLDLVRAALHRGLPCVLAAKGPLVLAYEELASLSDLSHPTRTALRFSGTVGGCLPSVNVGRRDLAGDHRPL